MASDGQTKIAKFRLFGGKNAEGMLFGEAAEICAELLGLMDALGQTRDKDACIRLSLPQVESVKEALEANGYEVLVIRPKNAKIGLGKNTASLIGDGAIVAGEVLGIPVGKTEKDRPLLRFPKERVDEVVNILKKDGFKVGVEEIKSNYPPKALFREDEENDEFHLYDASAKNVAEALGLTLDQTPGGRPKLIMPREEYKAAKKRLKELGFEVSQKDLELKAKFLASDETMQSGMFVGDDALEVAALLQKPLRYTAPTVKTGAPLPMVVLMSRKEIEEAQTALQGHGYTIEVKYRNEGRVANITLYTSGGIIFGDAAVEVSDVLEFPMERVASSGNPMVKVPADRMDEARMLLESQGYKLNETRRNEREGDRDQTRSDTKTANIVIAGNFVVIFRQAAEIVANAWDMDLEKQGNQSILKIPIKLIEELKQLLLDQGFEVERKQSEGHGSSNRATAEPQRPSHAIALMTTSQFVLFSPGAEIVGNAWNLPIEKQGQKSLIKLPLQRLPEVTVLLQSQGITLVERGVKTDGDRLGEGSSGIEETPIPVTLPPARLVKPVAPELIRAKQPARNTDF